jgi:hypothetical protein
MIIAAKTIGSAWVGALCFVIAYVISSALDRITSRLDKSKTRTRIFLEVFLQFAIIGAIGYGSRNLIKIIPFPVDGWSGYKHTELAELRSIPLFVFIFMFFQVKTQEKMRFLSA